MSIAAPGAAAFARRALTSDHPSAPSAFIVELNVRSEITSSLYAHRTGAATTGVSGGRVATDRASPSCPQRTINMIVA
jgi:hypothetical protein